MLFDPDLQPEGNNRLCLNQFLLQSYIPGDDVKTPQKSQKNNDEIQKEKTLTGMNATKPKVTVYISRSVRWMCLLNGFLSTDPKHELDVQAFHKWILNKRQQHSQLTRLMQSSRAKSIRKYNKAVKQQEQNGEEVSDEIKAEKRYQRVINIIHADVKRLEMFATKPPKDSDLSSSTTTHGQQQTPMKTTGKNEQKYTTSRRHGSLTPELLIETLSIVEWLHFSAFQANTTAPTSNKETYTPLYHQGMHELLAVVAAVCLADTSNEATKFKTTTVQATSSSSAAAVVKEDGGEEHVSTGQEEEEKDIVTARVAKSPLKSPSHVVYLHLKARSIAADLFILYSALLSRVRCLYTSSHLTQVFELYTASMQKLDPVLASHLTASDVSAELYIPRYVQLLLKREFYRHKNIFYVWDHLMEEFSVSSSSSSTNKKNDENNISYANEVVKRSVADLCVCYISYYRLHLLRASSASMLMLLNGGLSQVVKLSVSQINDLVQTSKDVSTKRITFLGGLYVTPVTSYERYVNEYYTRWCLYDWIKYTSNPTQLQASLQQIFDEHGVSTYSSAVIAARKQLWEFMDANPLALTSYLKREQWPIYIKPESVPSSSPPKPTSSSSSSKSTTKRKFTLPTLFQKKKK